MRFRADQISLAGSSHVARIDYYFRQPFLSNPPIFAGALKEREKGEIEGESEGERARESDIEIEGKLWSFAPYGRRDAPPHINRDYRSAQQFVLLRRQMEPHNIYHSNQ